MDQGLVQVFKYIKIEKLLTFFPKQAPVLNSMPSK